MLIQFKQDQSLRDFQSVIEKIYGMPDDRLYSLWDLLTQQQRFSMRSLKGIRKEDNEKIEINLLISFSWLMAIANRLHIDLENEVWRRFPDVCSYCGHSPCTCKKTKPSSRKNIKASSRDSPKTIFETQAMFERIYPSSGRTIADAGIHFAEEMGEVSESIHNYLGQHKAKLFDDIKLEIADFVSCVFGIANSAKINVAESLEELFYENCHVCHKAPCVCSFTLVSQYSV